MRWIKCLGAVFALVLMSVGGNPSTALADPVEYVTICHSNQVTGLDQLYITEAEAVGHIGGGHFNGEDIVPPFVYNGVEYSQNWWGYGIEVYNAGCKEPAPPPTPVPPTPVPPTPVPPTYVTLCRSTFVQATPLEMVTVTADVALGYVQNGTPDIVPPFIYQGQEFSENWYGDGPSIYNNGCVKAQAPTVPPTQAPPHPTQAPPRPTATPITWVTICAHTQAEPPYVQMTLTAEQVYNDYYGEDAFGGGSIIPPFVYGGYTFSQNWEGFFKQIYNNNCVIPKKTTPVPPTEVPPGETPTPTPRIPDQPDIHKTPTTPAITVLPNTGSGSGPGGNSLIWTVLPLLAAIGFFGVRSRRNAIRK